MGDICYSHGRSGRVAFPRTDVVEAIAVRFMVEGALARRALRMALFLNRVAAIVVLCGCKVYTTKDNVVWIVRR